MSALLKGAVARYCRLSLEGIHCNLFLGRSDPGLDADHARARIGRVFQHHVYVRQQEVHLVQFFGLDDATFKHPFQVDLLGVQVTESLIYEVVDFSGHVAVAFPAFYLENDGGSSDSSGLTMNKVVVIATSDSRGRWW